MENNTQSNAIRTISAHETFSVRHPVLRSGKPIETCEFAGDDLDTTNHFGFFDRNLLVGVISLFLNISPLFSEESQLQIRGMAILDSHRKHGIGRALILHAEEFARTRQTQLLWFNAREAAVSFYKNLGYTIVGDVFEIPDVGPHYLMFKRL